MVSEGKIGDFRNTLSSSMNLVFLMTLPSACGLVVLGEPIIRLLYSHGGAFKEADVPMTAWALSGYSIGLAGYAAIKVLSPAFYALDDARTPMMIGIASIAVNAVACYFFRTWLSGVGVSPQFPDGLGHVGVALATSTVALVNFAALAFFMRRSIGRLNGKQILSSFIKIAAASVILSVVCYASSKAILNYVGKGSLVVNIADALIPIALGGTAFLAAAKLLRIEEMDKLYNIFMRRLRPR